MRYLDLRLASKHASVILDTFVVHAPTFELGRASASLTPSKLHMQDRNQPLLKIS